MGCQIERDFADLLWLDGKDDDIGAAGGVAVVLEDVDSDFRSAAIPTVADRLGRPYLRSRMPGSDQAAHECATHITGADEGVGKFHLKIGS